MDGVNVTEADVNALANWQPVDANRPAMPFHPGRVLMQDFTGVPVIVDLAAMRSAVARLGGDPRRINPVLPVDLVIDHSLQVDCAGQPDADLPGHGRASRAEAPACPGPSGFRI